MRYDYKQISDVLNEVLGKLGPERFAKMKIIELEKYVRAHSGPTIQLPGRTQLRGAIHRFRKERWPDTAPKLRTGTGYS